MVIEIKEELIVVKWKDLKELCPFKNVNTVYQAQRITGVVVFCELTGLSCESLQCPIRKGIKEVEN